MHRAILLIDNVCGFLVQTEHEVTKHRVENESLKEAVVLLRSQQQGLQDELKETHQVKALSYLLFYGHVTDSAISSLLVSTCCATETITETAR